jgi:hypothetical protein
MLSPVLVFVTGGKQAIRYIDTRLVQRLQNFAANARAAGMTFTFDTLFRTQAQQAAIQTTNTKNTSGTSPHTAGLAFDVDVHTSLKPNGIDSLPALTAAARQPNCNFSPLRNQAADPPHFQANDLITRDGTGHVDGKFLSLIAENQQSFLDLERMRVSDPAQFASLVTTIDSFTTAQGAAAHTAP